MTHDTRRHDELFDKVVFGLTVWVFGTGGTGGEIARCLVGDGVGQDWSPLHLCDPDYFESYNVPSQLVTYHQAEKKMMKVEAVRENLLRVNPQALIHTHSVEAPHASLPAVSGVIFLCLDTMRGRRKIIEELLENNPHVRCVIDLRMDIPGAIAYCFDPNDPFQVSCYFDYWYDDDEADEIVGCNNQHFARHSSILGAVTLALKRFEDFTDNDCATQGIPNFAKLVYHSGYYELETWTDPNQVLDEKSPIP